jgi:hypothetical protein
MRFSAFQSAAYESGTGLQTGAYGLAGDRMGLPLDLLHDKQNL